MPRFQSRRALDASLGRRGVLFGAAGMALAGCAEEAPLTAATTPPLNAEKISAAVDEVARRVAPGALGAGIVNLDSGQFWTTNGGRRFPMQSVFKAPLGAAVLAEVDAGRVSLDESVVLEDTDLSPPYSPVADAWPARREWTLRELLTAAVGESDNTAADALMRRIGGPGAVTAWLVSHKIEEVRVDRYERELQAQCAGLLSFRPAWKGEAAFQAAMASVPEAERRAALQRYLADPRDTATPRGMLDFLQKLDSAQLTSPASARLLLQIMTDSPTGARRLKAALPPGARLAHKTGTGRTVLGVNPATNDVGIVTLADRRSYAVAVFLSGAQLVEEAREQAIADVGRALLSGVG